MSETETPRFLRRRPSEATLIPFPTDDATPPVTKINFDICFPPYQEPGRTIEMRFAAFIVPLFLSPGQGDGCFAPLRPTLGCYPRFRDSKMTTCVSAGKLLRVIESFGWVLIVSTPI